MRLLYAVQFEINSPGITSSALNEGVTKAVSLWISEWYSSRKDVQIEFPTTGGETRPIQDHEIQVVRKISKDHGVSHRLISWSYPDDNDGNLFWLSRVEIGEFDNRVEFSLQLFLDSTQYLIAPVDFHLKMPRIVGEIVRQFGCTCGDVRLSLEPEEITAASVEHFANTKLLSAERRLPIIVVSRNVSGDFLVAPTELAKGLVGIAETCYLTDKWAGLALTDLVGRSYACFNGAVRVYWPSLDLAARPPSPVYLPEKLSQFGKRFPEVLFRWLSSISALRYATGPITTDALEYLQDENRRDADALRLAAADRGDYGQLLEIADKENADLKKYNSDLREENASLRSNLQLARENFRAIGQIQAGSESPDEKILLEGEDAEIGSIEEAVLRAKSEFEDTIIVLDAAVDSAQISPFKQYKKAYLALVAIHEVCLSWRDSRKSRTPMGPFEQAFSAKGFTYKPKESATSTSKWAEEYEITYQGKRTSIAQHLAIGKGGPDTCLRIHFFLDEPEQKFVVAHVGRHKTNTKS